MAAVDRAALARKALDGYISGPDASTEATTRALAKAGDAETLVLVEGLSDQIAVETAAAGRGRDFAAERVVVVPIGGAHAIRRFVTSIGAVRVAALCDAAEEDLFRRALSAQDNGLRLLGVYVCVADLEDELIRAVGESHVEALFDSQGDLGSLRSMQHQPAWRGRDPAAQLRRFLGAGSARKLRYARLLVETASARGVLPAPLASLLDAV